ncbi:MAG TPA: SRPBCC family protein [Actinomycetes bacterium]
MTYPGASSDIDPVDRLTILAAALPGAAVGQRRIAAPFDAVWRVIADLEHATPRYEPGVAHVRVIEQRGELLRLLVQDTAGREDAMDARLRPGWCLMQSATVVIAFAARRLGSETLLAHLEHRRVQTPVPGRSKSHDRRAALAKIDQELHTIERLATHYGR